MSNALKGTSNDYKFVWDISNRFMNDKLGLLFQADYEKRNRGSEELGANYGNIPAELDSVNQLKLTNLNLSSIDRINDRKNSLFVLDYNIFGGNISYKGLTSKIKKDIVNRSDVYPVEQDSRYYHTGDGNDEIDVTTETWRYETNLFEDLSLELYKSFSSSKNAPFPFFTQPISKILIFVSLATFRIFAKSLGDVVNTNSNSSPPSKTNFLRSILFLFENSFTSSLVG